MRKFILTAVVFALFTIVTYNAYADNFEHEKQTTAAFNVNDVPDTLKSWVKWATDGNKPKNNCNASYNNFENKYCYYISELDLNIEGNSLKFKQNMKISNKGYALIPGSLEVFPTQVFVNGIEKNIISRNSKPYIFLEEGEYIIEGSAKSKEAIRSLNIPEQAAIINVAKDGQVVSNPTIDEKGVLRLENQSVSKSETDDINVFIYRKIADGVPVNMTVHLSLNVTGKERVENLGKIIPSNFSLMGVSGSVPAYIQKNGDLIIEARPGISTVDLALRQNADSLNFSLDNTPVEQEIWVFESDNSQRVIQAPNTLSSVQTQNVPMPEHWKSLPAYAVNKNDNFSLKAINYNNKSFDVLNLKRAIKLSFDGKFYSIQDHISGTFKQDGRLSVDELFNFYSSSMNGEPQAITYTSEDKNAGIEVRKGNADISNILRVENLGEKIPAAGYNRDFEDVSWNLQLAPGYKLFYASGVDKVSNSWISNWNLMAVFIVTLLSVCLYYLLGLKKALVSGFLVVILHHVFPMFTPLVFVLCGLLFLQRNIKAETFTYKLAAFIRYTLFFFLVVASFLFAVRHLRGAMYPSLDTGSIYISILSLKFLANFYITALFVYLFYRIFTGSMPGWKKALSTIGLIFAGLIASVVFALFSYGVPFGASAAKHMYYDSMYEDSARVEFAAPVAMQAESKMKARGVTTNLLQQMDKQLSLNKYQSVNVVKNVAQTGVGFPEWSNYHYSGINLYLKGPVTEGDSFRLYLITPFMNLVLAFTRVILGILLLYWLLDIKKTPINLSKKGKEIMKKIFVGAVFALMFLNPLQANASENIPSKEILAELNEKLSREYVPGCLPDCISIPTGKISNTGNEVKVVVSIHSNEKLVAPLPMLRADGAGFVKLDQIFVNDKPAINTVRNSDNVYLLLDKGVNIVEIKYSLDENADRFILYSLIRINYMENGLTGLSLNEDNSQYQSFQINRVKKVAEAKKTSELSKMDIDTFFTVNRTFDIETLWQVTTIVTRENNLSEAATIEIPLLNGEKVISSEGTLLKDKIRISFSPRETYKEFSSILPVEQNIDLQAPEKITNYKEIWSFNIAPVWSFKYKNLSPLISNDTSLIFQPRAGEKLDLQIFTPNSVEGYVITIDRVNYTLSSGRGVLESTVALDLRASDTGVHDITIPEHAEIKDLKINQRTYPVTVNGTKFTVPVIQGNNSIIFTVSIKKDLGSVLTFPEFNLNAPAVNITQTALVPLGRWVLFAQGPVKGPVVLFWSMIPALIIISFLLSRFKACPVNMLQWFILLLGLTQSGKLFMIIIIAWFISMGIKDKFSEQLKFKRLIQAGLAVLTLMFLYSLFNGVYNGLLGSWNMRIVGEGSYIQSSLLRLSWYQDATMGELPTPRVFSLPLWAYRCVMILWAAWLSVSFVKWMKWGFKAYTKD